MDVVFENQILTVLLQKILRSALLMRLGIFLKAFCFDRKQEVWQILEVRTKIFLLLKVSIQSSRFVRYHQVRSAYWVRKQLLEVLKLLFYGDI
jgi:hypothetical protein